MIGNSSIGHSIPRSPRAIRMMSAAAIMSSISRTALWLSIFATTCAVLPDFCRTCRNSSRSSFLRAKLSATKSTPSSTPRATSARSFSVSAGKFTWTPGEIDVPPRTECARSQDNGANPVVLFRQHAHLHEPVIEENNVVDRDVIDQTVIVDGAGIPLGAGCSAHGDLQH